MNKRLTIPNLPRNLKMITMNLYKTQHSPSKDFLAGSKRRLSYCPGKNVKKQFYSVFHARVIALGCAEFVLTK
jgi:hypothetical protein